MATEMIRAEEELHDRDEATRGGPLPHDAPPSHRLDPYDGIAAQPFGPEQAAVLLRPVDPDLVEIRPDGLIYLPEIRYRRILNEAFGPGAWGIMPRAIDVADAILYYRGALFVHGRFVAEAIGEQQYFPDNDRMSYATAAEAAKSNCLVRCCKDLGIASELWDPTYVRSWIERNAVEVWCIHRQDPKRRKKMWRRRDAGVIDMWPWFESGSEATDGRRDRQPAAEGTRSAEPAPSNGPLFENEGDRRPISPKQAGRFRAIARVHGWRDRETQRLLALHRVASVEEIRREDYDAICNELVDEDRLRDLRRTIEQEDSAEDVLNGLGDERS